MIYINYIILQRIVQGATINVTISLPHIRKKNPPLLQYRLKEVLMLNEDFLTEHFRIWSLIVKKEKASNKSPMLLFLAGE